MLKCYITGLTWGYRRIAEIITYSEFLLYPEIHDILFNEYECQLSINPHIPIWLFLRYPDISWSWSSISAYNQSISFQDLKKYQDLFDISSLSCNPSISLDWLLELYDLHDLDPSLLSMRITMNELIYMYQNEHLRPYIVWDSISMNHNLTIEFMNNHPDYPWDYESYNHPNYEYCKKHDLSYDIAYSSSIMVDKSLCDDELVMANRNLTFQTLLKYGLHERYPDSLHFNINSMNQPLLTDHYRRLYGLTVKEISY